MKPKLKILVTGSAGAIGKVLCHGLQDRHQLRGLDIKPSSIDDSIEGDITDAETVRQACDGMDVVIHLAGTPRGNDPWEMVLPLNFVGTKNVFDAAQECGLKRVVFASRAGLLASYPQDVHRTMDLKPYGTTYYSVSKIFGESLAHMFHQNHGLECVNVRIGNFNAERPVPEHPHHLGHSDAVHLFEQAAIHPDVGCTTVFGVSDSTWPLYDLEPGRKLIGYFPKQKSVIEPPAVQLKTD